MPGEIQRTARETVPREPRLDGSPQAARPSTADSFGRGPSPVARGPRTPTSSGGPRAARREIILTPFDELLELRHVVALNSLLCPAMLGGGIGLPAPAHGERWSCRSIRIACRRATDGDRRVAVPSGGFRYGLGQNEPR